MTLEDIALTKQKGLGDRGIVHLLKVMGSAERIYSASETELVDKAGLNREIARDIVRRMAHRDAEHELKYMRYHEINAVASTDENYPPLLRECDDFPHVIYVRGNSGILAGRSLAVVGTRNITPYGQRMYDTLIGRVAELSPGTLIVSGLALGGDANAHKAALQYGLPTVGVLANSFPDIMPKQNSRLGEEIIAAGGALITELHSQSKQKGVSFIPRNRIIAGMSEGTVVVESPRDGGSLYTAGYADGYYRTVMAVPGRSGDRCSEGTNMLIRRRQACMVCSGDDIIHELGWDISTIGQIPASPVSTRPMTADERRILECFGENESVSLDMLSQRSKLSVSETSSLLLDLEIDGIIRQLPGKIFETTRISADQRRKKHSAK